MRMRKELCSQDTDVHGQQTEYVGRVAASPMLMLMTRRSGGTWNG